MKRYTLLDEIIAENLHLWRLMKSHTVQTGMGEDPTNACKLVKCRRHSANANAVVSK